MLPTHDVIAFVATKHLERAKAFYSSVLGLRLVSDTPFALVFDARGTRACRKMNRASGRARTATGLVQGPGWEHAIADSVLLGIARSESSHATRLHPFSHRLLGAGEVEQ